MVKAMMERVPMPLQASFDLPTSGREPVIDALHIMITVMRDLDEYERQGCMAFMVATYQPKEPSHEP